MSEHPAFKELLDLSGTMAFDPERIFYSSDKASFFVDAGTFYRIYSRKDPVMKGIRRYLELMDQDPKEIRKAIPMHIEAIELDRAIDWDGKLAGYERGIAMIDGRRFLITDGYNIPDARRGQCPLHQSIIEQAFPDQEARIVYLGWLQGAVRAIRAGIHQPAPMLVMAGEKRAGKTLLSYIAEQAMGGRSANPMTAWTGILPWNDNLLGAELLLIDDSVASTDIRARKAFGARFKEAIYANNVEINTRRKSSITIRPVWRVMICCNETPENLSVIPPLEDGIEDKIALLRVAKVKLPMPAEAPAEKEALQRALADELPAFLDWLENIEIPTHLRDERSSITAWKDESLLEAVLEISPEHRLENLIALALEKGFLSDGWQSAQEIQGRLCDNDSPTAHQARALLRFDTNTGTYLSRLHKQESVFVADKKRTNSGCQYLITKP